MKNIFREILESVDRGVSDVALEVRFWDGDSFRLGHSSTGSTIEFKSESALERVMKEGSLGFGEEYMLGNIAIEGDIKQLIRLGLESQLGHPRLPLKTKLGALLLQWRTVSSRSQSSRNIQHHYDLGNEFYRLWLDKSMTYSCAYFRDASTDLERAQEDKYEHICRKLNLKQGESLLDIGCGWGGMLIHAAKNYGITGAGCTLSRQQFDYANEQIRRLKLDGRVSVLLEDYRCMQRRFDKIVSIGMFEHVGKEYQKIFMERLRDLLKPDGLGLLHTIAKDLPSDGDPWMNRYIFPGGYIPVFSDVVRSLCEQGFVVNDVENLRYHYARTLSEWSRRFEAAVPAIESMFDAQFVRMWRTYLNFCEASFLYGESRVYQFLFAHRTSSSYPLTREHVYQ